MLWSCNVLGSHAWPISRTCQIVAHWCIITARSCTSRQMDPIERKPFLGIHFIVYVFGASMCDVFTFEHVIVLSGVSQMDRMKWKLTTFGGQKRVALSRPNQLKIWLKIQKSTLAKFFLEPFLMFSQVDSENPHYFFLIWNFYIANRTRGNKKRPPTGILELCARRAKIAPLKKQ